MVLGMQFLNGLCGSKKLSSLLTGENTVYWFICSWISSIGGRRMREVVLL